MEWSFLPVGATEPAYANYGKKIGPQGVKDEVAQHATDDRFFPIGVKSSGRKRLVPRDVPELLPGP